MAIVSSLAFHLAMWPVGDRVVGWGGDAGPLPQSGGIMEVALLPLQEAQDAEETPPDPERILDPQDQLVRLDALENETPPPDTSYVSEFDNTVAQQTRAPKTRPRPGADAQPAGDRPDGQRGESEPSPSSPTHPLARALPLRGRDARSEAGEGTDSARDRATPEPDGERPADPGAAGAKLSPRGVPGLDGLRREWGSPGSYDDIEDAEDGDQNVLNSRRWKYGSFFNRVRDQVAQHWHPEVLHATHDPDGRVHGTKTRRTGLIISLNADGSLHRIRMEKSSDVDYLDEEAIRAVRAAQPFVNPPPQLVDPNSGKIEFGFAFIFEINGGTRIFRYRR
jgi:TonB family protein